MLTRDGRTLMVTHPSSKPSPHHMIGEKLSTEYLMESIQITWKE
jgi:hypothetical protein